MASCQRKDQKWMNQEENIIRDMYRKTNRTVKREVYAEQISINEFIRCPFCNKWVKFKEATLDHIVPVTVLKWCEREPTEEEINSFNDSANLLVVCQSCNERKNDSISARALEKCDVPKEKKENYARFYEKHKHLVRHFLDMKRDVLMSRGKKCWKCGKPVEIRTGIMRRIDPEQPRCRENACIYCEECNAGLQTEEESKAV